MAGEPTTKGNEKKQKETNQNNGTNTNAKKPYVSKYDWPSIKPGNSKNVG